jgi:hypothetical protein
VFIRVPIFAVNTHYAGHHSKLKSGYSSLVLRSLVNANLCREVHEQTKHTIQNNYSKPPAHRNKSLKMKKIILATMLVAFALTTFAGTKNNDKQLLNDLQAALKSSSQVKWATKTDYNQATFSFSGRAVSAFYDINENSLIGFSIHYKMDELPKEVADAITKKYADWTVIDAMLFIDSNGDVNYFAQVQKGKSSLALKIANGRAGIYTRMPS